MPPPARNQPGPGGTPLHDGPAAGFGPGSRTGPGAIANPFAAPQTRVGFRSSLYAANRRQGRYAAERRRRRYRRIQPLHFPGVVFWVAAVIISAMSIGLLTGPVALYSWLRFAQTSTTGSYRSDDVGARSIRRAWLLTSIAWTLVAIGSYAGFAVAGSQSTPSSSTPAFGLPPVHTEHAHFGDPLTYASIGAVAVHTGGEITVAVTVTPTDLRRSGGSVDVAVRVCAGATSVDPLGAVTELSIAGPDDTDYPFDTNVTLPDAFYSPLPASRCLTAPDVAFAVPAGNAITDLTTGLGLEDAPADWSLPSTGTPGS